MSDLYKFGYTLDETIKTMRDVIDTGNHDRMFLDTYYWLKMLSEYREIGTVEECRRSVEKQNPTKPEIYTDTVQTINGSFQRDVFECPVCGEYICNAEDEIPRYCCSCGQKLEECEGE